MSGARVPKIILFDLLCSAEPLFRIIALTSLNSIVKCNYIFDQLGSMFSVVLLFFFFFSPCLRYVNSCSRVSLWYLITFSINVKMYVAACVVCFSNRWKGFFASWIKGFFLGLRFLIWMIEFVNLIMEWINIYIYRNSVGYQLIIDDYNSNIRLLIN